jgi:CheY-like chemotaxis protein
VPERLAQFIPAGTVLYRAVGCPECASTGYRGRFSIVEVLAMNLELERLIGSGGTADRIAEMGRRNGMKSLWESGLRHVLRGETTLEELLRVTDVPQTPVREPVSAPPSPRSGQRGATASPPAPPSAVTALQAPPAFDFGLDLELLDESRPADGYARGERGICVLLVDDEDDLRRVMRDLLEREGFTVQEARDGIQALDEVDRHAPDIIVLDLNLPGLDGYSVLSQLRSRQATKDIPIVVLTAKGDEENEVKVFELGADDFLSKPFRARALAARLEAVLGRRGR